MTHTIPSSPAAKDVPEIVANDVISKLNGIYGKSLDNLSKSKQHVSELEALQNQLQNSLQFAADRAPDKLSKAINCAKQALSKCSAYQKEVSVLKNEISNVRKKASPIAEILAPDIKKLEFYRNAQIYQTWITDINKIGDQLEVIIKDGIDLKALNVYNDLLKSSESISKSQCTNLKKFTFDTLSYWHHTLQEKLTTDFNTSLKSIRWPFTKDLPTKFNEEDLEKLNFEIDFLFNLENSDFTVEDFKHSQLERCTSFPAVATGFDITCLVLRLFMAPIETRFLYHFSGNRATNNHENPEWYLTIVLKWFKAHETFLMNFVQPAVDRNKKDIDARIEFMKGLAKLVTVKLDHDVRAVLDDEHLLSSIIQETLNFERELRALGYPPYEPSVLRVFTQSDIFFKWRSLEEKISIELLDEFVSTPDAWNSLDNGPSLCGEQLLLLLQGITMRSMQLPQPGHKLQFLELQIEILDDFRVRLLQMTHSEVSDPIQSNYCAILNTIHAIICTLAEWSDSPFFVEMQYYCNQFKIHETAMRESISTTDIPQYPTEGGEEALAQYISVTNEQKLNFKVTTIDEFNIAQTALPSDAFDKVKGSPFDDTMTLYSHIESEMLSVICDHIMREARARSQRYRKEKWFHESQLTSSPVEISASLCPILDVLVRNLSALKQVMNKELFENVWKRTAASLSKFFYEDIILENNFSKCGINQLKYDVEKALFPLFRDYTSKPESYFELLRESLILLTLPLSTAILLRDLLDMDENTAFPSFRSSPVAALEEQGIQVLTIKQSFGILRLRNDLLKS